MRFIFSFLFVMMTTVHAFAAAVPAPGSSPVTGPVDALKQSLHKEDAPVSTTPGTSTSPTTWMDVSREQREIILQEWSALPETTRSPFPVFRDQAIRKLNRTPLQDANPLENDSAEE